MTLRVSGKNMDVGEALRTRAEGHFDNVVKKYFDGGYSGHLTLEPEGSGFNAQCRFKANKRGIVNCKLRQAMVGGEFWQVYPAV